MWRRREEKRSLWSYTCASGAEGHHRRPEVWASVRGVPLNWAGPNNALGNLVPELQQSTWHFLSSERGDKTGIGGIKEGERREREKCGPGIWATSLQVQLEKVQPGQGLDDHGLQQAEAHHEVQWDGWLQVVPIQPQVAQVWHILQI